MNWFLSHVPVWNGLIALILFWIPLLLCAYGYLMRSIDELAEDRKKRESTDRYEPNITLGSLVGRLLVTLVPVVNLVCAIFDIGPDVFATFIERCRKWLDVPLVPKRNKASE